jgi:phosphatidate phosphatase APP1
MDWEKLAYKLGKQAEDQYDRFKLSFRHRMGWAGPVQICPYITYCTQDTLFIKGRVLEDKNLNVLESDSGLRNLLKMYRRFNSNEIPGAKLRFRFNGTSSELVSDGDGYFQSSISLGDQLPSEELWHHPILELLEAPVPFTKPLMIRCEVMTPPLTAQFGIISDIDDTVLTTHATNIWKMTYMTFMKNAYSRLPFEGVASLLHALQQGISGANYNPLFYVSSSPWNLYDLLIDFFRINKIPKGPLLLRDLGFSEDKLFAHDHREHKLDSIRKVMKAYPHLPFVLVGDSGQQDPEIYAEVIKEFRGRVLAVYIRDVSVDVRDAEVHAISKAAAGEKIDLVLVKDSYALAAHAASKGLISEASLQLLMAEQGSKKGVNALERDLDNEIADSGK